MTSMDTVDVGRALELDKAVRRMDAEHKKLQKADGALDEAMAQHRAALGRLQDAVNVVAPMIGKEPSATELPRPPTPRNRGNSAELEKSMASLRRLRLRRKRWNWTWNAAIVALCLLASLAAFLGGQAVCP